MTKNSELLVMRACGISLYRAAAPLLLFAVSASGVLFVMQERSWPRQSRGRPAERDHPPLAARDHSALNRRWLVGERGEIYHYDLFDPRQNRVHAPVRVYQLDARRLAADAR